MAEKDKNLNVKSLESGGVPDPVRSAPVNVGNVSYQQLLDANPYRNVDYKESAWQRFLSALGFRTGADAYREQMKVQANETDFAILNKAYDEQYDSAAANVARERAAGLNPDLVGADQGGSSSPLRDDGNPPVPPGDDLESVSSFANTIMSAFSGAIGLAKEFGDLDSIFLSNDRFRLENARDYARTAMDIVVAHTQRSDFGKHGLNYGAIYNRVDNYARDTMGLWPGSRRYNKFMKSIDNVFASVPTEQKQFDAWLNDQQSIQKGVFFNQRSDYDDSLPLLRFLGKSLGKFYFTAQKYKNEADEWKNYNDLNYQQVVDPEAEAYAKNAKNEYDTNFYEAADGTEQGEFTRNQATAKNWRLEKIKAFNDEYDDLVKGVQGLVDDGDRVATYFLTFLNLMRLRMLDF